MTKYDNGILFISVILIFIALASSMLFVKPVYSTNLPIEENGGVAVNVQDQTTRPFDIRANQILDSTSYALAVTPTINSYDLELNTTVGLSIGDSISFLEQNGDPQILFGTIENIVGNVITLDSPVPYPFIVGKAIVFTFTNDLTVDGSVTTEVFGLTNFFEQAVDITRVIFTCRDTTSIDDSRFCGGTELDRGVVLRKKNLDGNYTIYWNVKNNGQWGDLAYDSAVNDRAPSGEYGFKTRLTYGGQSKHGVVIRLEPGESIEVLVQDDLTGLTYGSFMIEGHFTQN